MDIFNARFKELVEESGKSSRELAKALGISNASISRYTKDRSPNVKQINKIASYFHVSVNWLIGEDDSREDSSENINVLYNKLPKSLQKQLIKYANFLLEDGEGESET